MSEGGGDVAPTPRPPDRGDTGVGVDLENKWHAMCIVCVYIISLTDRKNIYECFRQLIGNGPFSGEYDGTGLELVWMPCSEV